VRTLTRRCTRAGGEEGIQGAQGGQGAQEGQEGKAQGQVAPFSISVGHTVLFLPGVDATLPHFNFNGQQRRKTSKNRKKPGYRAGFSIGEKQAQGTGMVRMEHGQHARPHASRISAS
jgi:hypothetical protein